MSDQLKATLGEAIARGASLEKLADLLRGYRDTGGSQEAARSALEFLRAGADEDTEDRILEVTDIVLGFCAERQRVWDSS